MLKLIAFINYAYLTIYYKLLKHIYFKYNETKYGSIIIYMLHVILLKRIWYDKISPKFDMSKHIETMSGIHAKNIFRHINHRLKSNYIPNISVITNQEDPLGIGYKNEIDYTISFVIQYKKVLINGLEEREINVPKKLVFARFDTNHYPTHIIKPIKEIFTFAAQSYMQKGEIKHYRNIEKKSDRIYLEIENEDDLLRLKKILHKFKMHFQIKNKPYVKRKFGKTETVLNTQEIYRKTFKYGDAMYLLCKLFNIKYDVSEEVITLKDLTS